MEMAMMGVAPMEPLRTEVNTLLPYEHELMARIFRDSDVRTAIIVSHATVSTTDRGINFLRHASQQTPPNAGTRKDIDKLIQLCTTQTRRGFGASLAQYNAEVSRRTKEVIAESKPPPAVPEPDLFVNRRAQRELALKPYMRDIPGKDPDLFIAAPPNRETTPFASSLPSYSGSSDEDYSSESEAEADEW